MSTIQVLFLMFSKSVILSASFARRISGNAEN